MCACAWGHWCTCTWGHMCAHVHRCVCVCAYSWGVCVPVCMCVCVHVHCGACMHMYKGHVCVSMHVGGVCVCMGMYVHLSSKGPRGPEEGGRHRDVLTQVPCL